MENKRFYERWNTYFRIAMIYLMGIFVLPQLFYSGIGQINSGNKPFGYLLMALSVGMFVVLIWMYITLNGPQLDWLDITGEYIEWHCFLRRKHRLYFKDCRYLGVETYGNERGFECEMIYFSPKPYPEDKHEHIDRIHCSDEFIKFPYTDKLAETVMEVLPEKSDGVRAFYEHLKDVHTRG